MSAADHLLDRHVTSVTRSMIPFFLISNVPRDGLALDLARAADGVDCGLEVGLVGRLGAHKVAFASFFTIRTSMPPPAAAAASRRP
jgi:hypothetical protein